MKVPAYGMWWPPHGEVVEGGGRGPRVSRSASLKESSPSFRPAKPERIIPLFPKKPQILIIYTVLCNI